jgi:hypothetical protein
MKPIFNKLLEESLNNPSEMMLEKFLAFKKSLMAFETNVASVKKALDGLLENDLDMADLVPLFSFQLHTFTINAYQELKHIKLKFTTTALL